MSSHANGNVEESANWDEEIERELKEIAEVMQETQIRISVVQLTDKIVSTVKRRKEVEEAIRRENTELRKQLSDQKFQLDEMEMERDVLLQQVHAYLEMNSSLRIRLEEQRCQTGALKNQLNGDLETKIRKLERDKEKLIDMNVEKEKEVDKMMMMLEQARRRREGNEENGVTALKEELQRALEDKMKAEGRLREVLMERRKAGEKPWMGRKRESGLRRSVSEGNVSKERFECLERNIMLEGPCDCITNSCKLRQKGLRTEEGSIINRSDCLKPSDATEQIEFPETPVHAQLDSLRRGLFNVTRKLEYLKTQLISSGAIKEEVKEAQRNLKRKAKTMETEGNLTEEPNTGFKNLKNILEDAKTLNAKLENLRDEKQKIIDMARKEKQVQVETKKNDVWSQTTETGRYFQKAITRLKRAVCECESELEKGSKEKAFASFTSALIFFILCNLRHFNPSRLNLDDEKDPFREEGLNGSKENGGGDNPLKIDENPNHELKIQIARLKFKIELFENLGVQQKDF